MKKQSNLSYQVIVFAIKWLHLCSHNVFLLHMLALHISSLISQGWLFTIWRLGNIASFAIWWRWEAATAMTREGSTAPYTPSLMPQTCAGYNKLLVSVQWKGAMSKKSRYYYLIIKTYHSENKSVLLILKIHQFQKKRSC